MSLFPCKECGKQISDQEVSCPECGCPLKVGSNSRKIAILVVLVVSFLVWNVVLTFLEKKKKEKKVAEIKLECSVKMEALEKSVELFLSDNSNEKITPGTTLTELKDRLISGGYVSASILAYEDSIPCPEKGKYYFFKDVNKIRCMCSKHSVPAGVNGEKYILQKMNRAKEIQRIIFEAEWLVWLKKLIRILNEKEHQRLKILEK